MLYKPKFLSPAATSETKGFEYNNLNNYTFSCICDGNEKVKSGTLELIGGYEALDANGGYWGYYLGNPDLPPSILGRDLLLCYFILDLDNLKNFHYKTKYIDNKLMCYFTKISVKGIKIAGNMTYSVFGSLDNDIREQSATTAIKEFLGIAGDFWLVTNINNYYNNKPKNPNQCDVWHYNIDNTNDIYLKSVELKNPVYRNISAVIPPYVSIEPKEYYFYKSNSEKESGFEQVSIDITFPENGELILSYDEWENLKPEYRLYFGGLKLEVLELAMKPYVETDSSEGNLIQTYDFNKYPINSKGEYNIFEFPVNINFAKNVDFKWKVTLTGESGIEVVSALEKTFLNAATNIRWYSLDENQEKQYYDKNITVLSNNFISQIEFISAFPAQYYYYEIFNNKNKIYESAKIYSQDIQILYDNLINNESYEIKIIIVNSLNHTYEDKVFVKANYSTSASLDMKAEIIKIPHTSGVYLHLNNFLPKVVKNIGNVQIREMQESGFWKYDDLNKNWVWRLTEMEGYDYVKKNCVAEFFTSNQQLLIENLGVKSEGVYWCGCFSNFSNTTPFLTIQTNDGIYKIYFGEKGFYVNNNIPEGYVTLDVIDGDGNITEDDYFDWESINLKSTWFQIFIGFIQGVAEPVVFFNAIVNKESECPLALAGSAKINQGLYAHEGAYKEIMSNSYYCPLLALSKNPYYTLEKKEIQKLILQNNDNYLQVSHCFIENCSLKDLLPFYKSEDNQAQFLLPKLINLNTQPYWNYCVGERYWLKDDPTIIQMESVKGHENHTILFNLNFEIKEPYKEEDNMGNVQHKNFEKKPFIAGDPALSGDISSVTIKRKDVESNSMITVGTIENNNDDYCIVDYGTRANRIYEYYIYPNIEANFTSPVKTYQFTTDWDGWTLFTVDGTDNPKEFLIDQIFMFNLNITSGTMSNNNDATVVKNFTPYPRIQKTPYCYWSGELSGLLGYIAPNLVTYIQTPEQLEEFKHLSLNGKRKFLKDRDGNLFEIEISGPLSIENQDNLSIDLKTKKLPWTEIGSAKDVSLIMKDNNQIEWLLSSTDYNNLIMKYRWQDNSRWLDSNIWTEGVR